MKPLSFSQALLALAAPVAGAAAPAPGAPLPTSGRVAAPNGQGFDCLAQMRPHAAEHPDCDPNPPPKDEIAGLGAPQYMAPEVAEACLPDKCELSYPASSKITAHSCNRNGDRRYVRSVTFNYKKHEIWHLSRSKVSGALDFETTAKR